jgi:multidrug efflux system membrane fusion protein
MSAREAMRQRLTGRHRPDVPAPGRWRRLIGTALFIAVLIGAGVMGERVVSTLDTSPRTSDAQIAAETTRIGAPLPGRIVELAVGENQPVKKGAVLFRLDPAPYRLALQEAEATLAAASAELAAARRRSDAETANADAARDEIQRAEDDLALAERTVERLTPLAESGIVSQQTYDEAVTARANAQTALRQARQAAVAGAELIETTEALEAERDAARAAAALARWELEKTTVRAPFDGVVVGLSAAAGQYLIPGESILTVIDGESWHALALVRETDLGGIHRGGQAEVSVAIDPATTLHGRVESIGRGIQPTDDVDLAGRLPYIQATLDWVQVAKRFPVRIDLTDPPDHLQRLGASARVVFTPAAATAGAEPGGAR